jgi:Holliday junction resolvase RusA-like endonuclease
VRDGTAAIVRGDDMTLRFFVAGVPAPGGSKTAIPYAKPDGKLGVRTFDSGKNNKSWREAVRAEAYRAMDGRPMFDGVPLRVLFRFYRSRPRSHYGSGRNAEVVKPACKHLAPITRPDVLKLARSTEDAMTGVVWKDDSQITSETIEKRWHDHPSGQGCSGVWIEVDPWG